MKGREIWRTKPKRQSRFMKNKSSLIHKAMKITAIDTYTTIRSEGSNAEVKSTARTWTWSGKEALQAMNFPKIAEEATTTSPAPLMTRKTIITRLSDLIGSGASQKISCWMAFVWSLRSVLEGTTSSSMCI
jgi:hypothetical protein